MFGPSASAVRLFWESPVFLLKYCHSGGREGRGHRGHTEQCEMSARIQVASAGPKMGDNTAGRQKRERGGEGGGVDGWMDG